MIKLTKRQCDVISAYAFGNMTLEGAAKELGCHRNTIFYHLSVIREQTGLDPEAYIVYAQLVRKDREAKREYRATHDNWTVGKGQMSRRKEKYRIKKAKGVSI